MDELEERLHEANCTLLKERRRLKQAGLEESDLFFYSNEAYDIQKKAFESISHYNSHITQSLRPELSMEVNRILNLEAMEDESENLLMQRTARRLANIDADSMPLPAIILHRQLQRILGVSSDAECYEKSLIRAIDSLLEHISNSNY